MQKQDPHTVVIGAGFGGLRVSRALSRKGMRVTLIDRRSYHLFTPLLYQVATGTLSPSQIAVPVRSLFRNRDRVNCLMAAVHGVDLEDRRVVLEDGRRIAYDYLVVAAGAQSHYFGNEDQWKDKVDTLDDIASACSLRDRFLIACERAELEDDPEARRQLLTVAIIGAGPSGVELAGAIADLADRTLSAEYQRISPGDVAVHLYEAQDRVLPVFEPQLSQRAQEQLEELGVHVHLGKKVDSVQEHAVIVEGERVVAGLICWGSGVRPANLAQRLGVETEKGAIKVDSDCSVPGHPRVFAIGDIARFVDDRGQILPGLAPVALQQGAYVAKTIIAESRGGKRTAFRYRDKGIMATIGRARAVVQAGPVKLSGPLAWLTWVALHIYYLIGFRTRLLVLWEWCWAYVGRNRGNRIVVSRTQEEQAKAEAA